MQKKANSCYEFSEKIPKETLKAIQEVLHPLEWLLPPWIQRCYVSFPTCGSEHGFTCDMNCEYEYRYIAMRIYPAWLDLSDYDRRETCIHELLHSMTSILADYARNELKRLLPEDEAPKYRESVIKELTMRHESMTQDMAYVICKHLESNGTS